MCFLRLSGRASWLWSACAVVSVPATGLSLRSPRSFRDLFPDCAGGARWENILPAPGPAGGAGSFRRGACRLTTREAPAARTTTVSARKDGIHDRHHYH